MAVFGVIAFKRFHVLAAHFSLEESARTVDIAHDPELRDEAVHQVFQIIDQTPEGAICDAVDWLVQSSGGPIDFLCVTGYGPFVSLRPEMKTEEPEAYGKVSHTAHPPFAGMSPLTIASERLRERHKIKLGAERLFAISDAEAIAIAHYWKNYLQDEKEQVIAGLIVGLGIGGAIARGHNIRQTHHSEMGHIPTPQHPDYQILKSTCDRHMGCIDGLASVVALKMRYERMKGSLGCDKFNDVYTENWKNEAWEKYWEVESFYLSNFLMSIVMIAAPSKIILTGSIIEQAPFLMNTKHKSNIIKTFDNFLSDYIEYPALKSKDFICVGHRHDDMLAGGLHHAIRAWKE